MIRATRFPGIAVDANPRRSPFNPTPRYSGTDHGAEKNMFYARMAADLDTISQLTLGSELLSLIRKRHEGIGTSESGARRQVIIQFRPYGVNEGASTMATSAGDRLSKVKNFGGRDFHYAGKGNKTYISMHNSTESEAIYTRLAGTLTLTYIALAHELIHAFHHLSGTTYSDSVTSNQGEAKREEMVTTGFGVYANTRLSENAIRDEVGLTRRHYYSFEGDMDLIGSLIHKGRWQCSAMQD